VTCTLAQQWLFLLPDSELRPTTSYSFSFAPNYTSRRIYPKGPEFIQYLHRVAENYKLVENVQLNTDITELRYVEEDEEWEVHLAILVLGAGDLNTKERQQRIDTHGKQSIYIRQEIARAKLVFSCLGILVEPNAWPKGFAGNESFRGNIIHSARWRDVELMGKNIVVVGTGASAAQIVPALFKEPYNAKSVTQVMRTPPWVMPRLKEPFGKEAYARWAPIVLGYASFIGYLTRVSIHLLAEMIWHGLFMLENVKWRSKVEKSLLDRMRSKVPEKYHEIMTPNYPYGCKRRVFDDEWLDTMNSPNFHLTTEHLTRLVPDGLILGPGRAYPENLNEKDSTTLERHVPTDTIILANGFDAVRWMHPLMVYGRGGRSMLDVWKERGGAQAYMGTSLDGFPNFFMTLGPNSANGHAPLLTTIEYTID
jgi:cation diffusion facilitator CzcD-associated flavoprotein CzcO